MKQQRTTKDFTHTREEPPVPKGKLPCTGRMSLKLYKCLGCGKEQHQETNHWGYTYGHCSCGHSEWECQEAVPEGMTIPARWKRCCLGDIAEIS